MKYFVSYNQADRAWADWIAWQIEEQGMTAVIQSWDFAPGSNFILEMHKAASHCDCVIAVLSPDYLTSRFTAVEWSSALSSNPDSGRLLPVRVRACKPEGLLASIVFVDLVGLDQTAAQKALVAALKGRRLKPECAPGFPARDAIHPAPAFPPTVMQEPSTGKADEHVQTWVVDPSGRRDFTTIGDAIHHAQPGHAIRVRPGVYREVVRIDKPVDIRGEGEARDIVVEGSGAVMLIAAPSGRIENLSIRQLGTGVAVEVVTGTPVIENCEITSFTSACIAVHAPAAPSLFRNCILNCRLSVAEAPGLIVRAGKLEGSLSGAGVGILLLPGSAANITHNRIFGNRIGVEIRNAAPILRDNHICNNLSYGVVAAGRSGGEIIGNDLRNNRCGPISMPENTAADTLVEDNLV